MKLFFSVIGIGNLKTSHEQVTRMNHQLATTPESKYMQSPKGRLVQACKNEYFVIMITLCNYV